MKDLLRSFAATAAIQLANLASGIALARLLLPEGRGELATVILWPSVIAALGLLGINEAVAFHVARRREADGQIYAAGLALALLSSVLLLPIAWAVVDRVSGALGPEARAAAFLYLAFIPLNQIGLVVVALHQGSLSIGRWNVLRVSPHVVYTLLILVLAAGGRGTLLGFASASLASTAAPIALGLALGRGRHRLPRMPGLAEARGEARALLGYGVRIHVSNAVAMLGERADLLAISAWLAPEALGLYVVAATVARGLGGIGDTLATLMFPKAAGATTPERRAGIVGRYTRAALLLSVPPAAFGIALAHWLIVLIFGPTFAGAAPAMQVLLVGSLAANVKAVMGAALKGSDRPLAAGAAQAVGLVVSLALLAALLPAVGLVGAAVAFLASQTAAVATMAVQLHRRAGIRLRSQLRPSAADLGFVLALLRLRAQGSADE